MVDELEEQGGQELDVQHYLGVVKRRHLNFLIPLFVGWAAVWGASWVLPPRYQSSTLILVEQRTMPKDYVPQTSMMTCRSGCKASLSRFSAGPIFFGLRMAPTFTLESMLDVTGRQDRRNEERH